MKVTPKIGMNVKPDDWIVHSTLEKGDDYSDSSYPGSDFRVRTNNVIIASLAVNVEVTGRKSYYVGQNYRRIRAKIEFVGDGEPSQFSGGWLYFSEDDL